MEALWSGSIDEWTEPTQLTPSGRGRRRPSVEPAPPPGDEPGREAAAPPPLPVEVVRSARRRKSVSARIVDGRIVVRMPAWMSKAQEAEYVASLVSRLERQRSAAGIDLAERARSLARRYDLPEPRSIRWVANQAHRWGSCTPADGSIRISDRVAGFPAWVVDAVIVHELAHLVHLHHTPEFWALVDRYPKAERAYGFLIAMAMAADEVT